MACELLEKCGDQILNFVGQGDKVPVSLFEDFHWLILLIGHICVDVTEGEEVQIPSEIRKYSLSVQSSVHPALDWNQLIEPQAHKRHLPFQTGVSPMPAATARKLPDTVPPPRPLSPQRSPSRRSRWSALARPLRNYSTTSWRICAKRRIGNVDIIWLITPAETSCLLMFQSSMASLNSSEVFDGLFQICEMSNISSSKSSPFSDAIWMKHKSVS